MPPTSSPPSSSPTTDVAYSSWLSKRAEWRFAWDRRVVSLQGKFLSYKEGPNKPDKKAGTLTSFQRECSTPLTFRVWVDVGETWTLRADDEHTYRRWVGVLTRAALSEEEEGGSSHNESSATQPTATSAKRYLSATVMKRSYWTHTWRPRFIELAPHGCTIDYSEERGGTLRGRVNVVAVDPVAPSSEGDGVKPQVLEVAFQSQNGEGFHVRFESEKVAAAWVVAFRERLGGSRGCRWQALRVQKASSVTTGLIMSATAAATSRFGHHGGTSTDAALGRVAHCTFVERDHLFVFGGRTSAGFSCMDEMIGAFNGIPSDTSLTNETASGEDAPPPSQLCSKDLFHVRLSGDFIANPTAVQPFEEKGRAKIRPVEREGAAGCVIGDHWAMHGGRTFTSGTGGVLSDVWSIDLQALSSGVGLGWTRRSDDAVVASSESQPSPPALAFHTATPISADTILLCGGTSDGVDATNETWLLGPLSGSVRRGPPMPSARLQHAAVAIPSHQGISTSSPSSPSSSPLEFPSHILVVGGSKKLSTSSSSPSPSSTAALPLMLLLDVASMTWSEVGLQYSPDIKKLPSFSYPSAAVMPIHNPDGALARLLVYGGSHTSRKLPTLVVVDLCKNSSNTNHSQSGRDNSDDGEMLDSGQEDDAVPEYIASNAPSLKRPPQAGYVAKIRPVCALGDTPTYACGMQLVIYGGYVYLVGGGGDGGVALPRLMLNTI